MKGPVVNPELECLVPNRKKRYIKTKCKRPMNKNLVPISNSCDKLMKACYRNLVSSRQFHLLQDFKTRWQALRWKKAIRATFCGLYEQIEISIRSPMRHY